MIALLDRIDGGDNEPSLGFTRPGAGAVHVQPHGDDLELDEADAEPNLASPECQPADQGSYAYKNADVRYGSVNSYSQVGWARGNSTDLEGHHEDDEDGNDAEPDVDSEPNGDENEPWLAGAHSDGEDADCPAAPAYQKTLRARRAEHRQADRAAGFGNVRPIDGQRLTLIGSDGEAMRGAGRVAWVSL